MNDYFKMFLIALVTSVATQLLLTPYILRLQGVPTSPLAPSMAARVDDADPAAAAADNSKLSSPNLEGMTVAAARDRWRDKGLVIIEDGERAVSEGEPGTILQQRPAPGNQLASNKEIRVIVARASQEKSVPDVVGGSLDDARIKLTAAGFEMGEPRQEASEEPAGTVLKQVPASDSKAKGGSIVRITVASAAAIEVPKIRGLYLSRAKKMLASAGLAVGTIRRVEDAERGENYVLRQDPAPGEKVPPGTEIELVVVAPN